MQIFIEETYDYYVKFAHEYIELFYDFYGESHPNTEKVIKINHNWSKQYLNWVFLKLSKVFILYIYRFKLETF